MKASSFAPKIFNKNFKNQESWLQVWLDIYMQLEHTTSYSHIS